MASKLRTCRYCEYPAVKNGMCSTHLRAAEYYDNNLSIVGSMFGPAMTIFVIALLLVVAANLAGC